MVILESKNPANQIKSHEEPRGTGSLGTRISLRPLYDPVTWYGINYAGMQVTQWDFQNKGRSGWTGASSFVFEVPLCNLRPSIIKGGGGVHLNRSEI